jgi:hypothetical protein
MIEALWSIEFNSGYGYVGRGVVIFDNNRVFGGDIQYYYIGTYTIQDQILSAKVIAVYYDQGDEPFSLFNTTEKRIALHVSGQVQQHAITASAYRSDAPENQVMVRLTRQAELPVIPIP